MITVEEAISAYYDLRNDHNRPTPRGMPLSCVERDQVYMKKFLSWCAEQDIDDPVGFMQERFSAMYRASRHKVVPRIEQLPHAKLAERWTGWIEGQRIADASYAKRVANDDQLGMYIKELASDPLPGQEAVKRRRTASGHIELCLAKPTHSGGYHPVSAWCQQCPVAVRCAARLNEEYGFDVVALRSGEIHRLPDQIAAALIR